MVVEEELEQDKPNRLKSSSGGEIGDETTPNQQSAAVPLLIVRKQEQFDDDYSPTLSVTNEKSFLLDPNSSIEDEYGTPQDQFAFMKELQLFHKQRGLDFKPPKFYGEPLNLLKSALILFVCFFFFNYFCFDFILTFVCLN